MSRLIERARNLVLAGVVATALASCGGSDPWTSKATASEKAASEKVGGFSDDDKKLYHQGLQHIANAHKNIGSFTIGQVVEQERARQQQRAAAAAKADDATASANLRAAMDLANRTGGVPDMYRGGIIQGDQCGVRIDAAYYERTSRQNQDIIKQTVAMMCTASYRLLGHGRERQIPSGGLTVTLVDLADNRIYHENFFPASR